VSLFESYRPETNTDKHNQMTALPGHKYGTRSPGHRVSNCGWIGSDHRSVCQIRYLTNWVLTCTFICICFHRVTQSRQT